MKRIDQSNTITIIKRGLYSLLLVIGLTSTSFGQQSAVYSQYVFNRLVINPAYAGSQEQLSITTLHRRQWDNFEGAPTTNTLVAHKSIKNKNVGIGILASSEKIGVHADQRLFFMYSYKIKMVHGTLSMGLQGGFSRIQSDFSKLNLKSEDVLVSGFRNTFNPNFGTGLYYSNNNFFAGVSVPHLLNNKLNREAEIDANGQEKRYYFVTAGHIFTLNPMVKVLPSVLMRVQESNATSIDVGANLILNDVLTIGGSYRSEDALIALLKLNISENLSMGYSYDHTLSDIGQYSNGSHEFMLGYQIPYSKKCQTYF